MRVLLIALLAAISYAQTAFGNCEANLTPETCTGNGDDGYPCQWHYGDNSCKENSDGGLPTGGSTSGGDMPMGDFPVTQGGDMPMGDFPVTQGGVVYGNDGCEEFLEATCSTQAGENGESCHWVIGEGCKKADCEHFLTSETCTGKTGEHGRACVFLADEGCEETPGIDGSGNGFSYPLEQEGCESYGAETCASNVGEGGVACHFYESECKESNCEHYLTPEDCNRATSEDGETCAWNIGEENGCKEASDLVEQKCDMYDSTACATATGENGKQCFWDLTQNDGLGKCDEDNTTEISDVPAFENPGLLRSIHKTKLSSPSAWDYLAVFSITFFMTAGVTFFTLGKCTSQEKESIDMSYRAVV